MNDIKNILNDDEIRYVLNNYKDLDFEELKELYNNNKIKVYDNYKDFFFGYHRGVSKEKLIEKLYNSEGESYSDDYNSIVLKNSKKTIYIQF